MLEKYIEAEVCKYAKSKGVIAYKFTSPATWAVPDRLFISPQGKIWFCEFKRKGKNPTPLQEAEHARLRTNKAVVYIIDNSEDGFKMVDEQCS